MEKDIITLFADKLKEKLDGKFTLRSEVDRKGVTCGWCKLEDPAEITKAAQIVADFKGRIMTISALISADKHVEISYHFYFENVNCTVSITLPDNSREVKSITPILKSADWHEREIQEFYKIKLIGHPNPRALFLDKSIQMDKNTMISLSAAMNGSSTSTLWEKVMKSNFGEEKQNE